MVGWGTYFSFTLMPDSVISRIPIFTNARIVLSLARLIGTIGCFAVLTPFYAEELIQFRPEDKILIN